MTFAVGSHSNRALTPAGDKYFGRLLDRHVGVHSRLRRGPAQRRGAHLRPQSRPTASNCGSAARGHDST